MVNSKAKASRRAVAEGRCSSNSLRPLGESLESPVEFPESLGEVADDSDAGMRGRGRGIGIQKR